MQTFKMNGILWVWGKLNIFITSSRSNNSLRKFGVTLMVDWNILTQLKESIVSDYCFNFVFKMLERLLKLPGLGFCIVVWFAIKYIQRYVLTSDRLDLRNWHECKNYKLQIHHLSRVPPDTWERVSAQVSSHTGVVKKNYNESNYDKYLSQWFRHNLVMCVWVIKS